MDGNTDYQSQHNGQQNDGAIPVLFVIESRKTLPVALIRHGRPLEYQPYAI